MLADSVVRVYSSESNHALQPSFFALGIIHSINTFVDSIVHFSFEPLQARRAEEKAEKERLAKEKKKKRLMRQQSGGLGSPRLRFQRLVERRPMLVSRRSEQHSERVGKF